MTYEDERTREIMAELNGNYLLKVNVYYAIDKQFKIRDIKTKLGDMGITMDDKQIEYVFYYFDRMLDHNADYGESYWMLLENAIEREMQSHVK